MLSETEIKTMLMDSELERNQLVEEMQAQFEAGTWDEDGFEAQSERILVIQIRVLKRVLGIE